MIEKLTVEQEARLVEHHAEYLAIGSSTEPADEKRAERAITGLYKEIGEDAPEFIWCDSPASALLTMAVLEKLGEEPPERAPFSRGSLLLGMSASCLDNGRRILDHVIPSLYFPLVATFSHGMIERTIASLHRMLEDGALKGTFLRGAVPAPARYQLWSLNIPDSLMDSLGPALVEGLNGLYVTKGQLMLALEEPVREEIFETRTRGLLRADSSAETELLWQIHSPFESLNAWRWPLHETLRDSLVGQPHDISGSGLLRSWSGSLRVERSVSMPAYMHVNWSLAPLFRMDGNREISLRESLRQPICGILASMWHDTGDRIWRDIYCAARPPSPNAIQRTLHSLIWQEEALNGFLRRSLRQSLATELGSIQPTSNWEPGDAHAAEYYGDWHHHSTVLLWVQEDLRGRLRVSLHELMRAERHSLRRELSRADGPWDATWGNLISGLALSPLRESLQPRLHGNLLTMQFHLEARGAIFYWGYVWDCLHGVRETNRFLLGRVVRAVLADTKAISKRLNQAFYGQHEVYWIAFYKFCEEIGVKYSEDDSRRLHLWDEVARSCGWWWPYKGLVVACRRPTEVVMEQWARREYRLHCADGPALRFADGYALWSWHGVQVPREAIECPEKMTTQQILDEPNKEVQRVMTERFGLERFTRESGAEAEHRDERGILWRFPSGDKCVEVTDPVLQKDGSRGTYFLACSDECERAAEAVYESFPMLAERGISESAFYAGIVGHS